MGRASQGARNCAKSRRSIRRRCRYSLATSHPTKKRIASQDQRRSPSILSRASGHTFSRAAPTWERYRFSRTTVLPRTYPTGPPPRVGGSHPPTRRNGKQRRWAGPAMVESIDVHGQARIPVVRLAIIPKNPFPGIRRFRRVGGFRSL